MKQVPSQALQELAILYGQGDFNGALNKAKPLLIKHAKSPQLRNFLGAIYNGLGNFKEAEANFKKAIALHPLYAEAYSNLGSFYFTHDKHAKAIESYHSALEIKPDYSDAHRNLGNVFASGKKLTAALKHFREAVKLSPKDPQNHIALAAAYQKCLNHNGAIQSYKTALKIDPKNVSALIGLGVSKSAISDIDAAIKHYKSALKLNPNHAIAHNNLGAILRETGEMDEALFHSKEAVRFNPDYAGAYRNLSLIKTYKEGDQQIEAMLAFAKKKGINNADLCHVSFALGKAFEDIDDTENAFYWLKRGNILRKRELNYNIGQDQKLFATIKDAFKADIPKATKPETNKIPIFIVGMPRSGTSLIEQILASHSDIHGAGELDYLFKSITANSWQKEATKTTHINDIQNRYTNQVKRLNISEPYITDKMPINFRWIGFIMAAFPNAKIIHIKRDPRATCWSIFKHYFSLNGNGYAYDLNDLTRYYRLYEDLMHFWHEKFPNAICDISYEKLTEDQETQTRNLIAHIGVDWQDKCLSFYKNARAVRTASTQQVRQKIYQGSSEAWKKYEFQLDPFFKILKSS